MRIIEFFSGIGGFAEALRQQSSIDASFADSSVVRAIDIDQSCGEVYQSNFGHAPLRRSIESATVVDEVTRDMQADTWWMSPPCQPYCRRRSCDPSEDPRALPLRAIMTWLERADSDRLPRCLMLENVPEFQTSLDAYRLRTFLAGRDYRVAEYQICPTMLGIPNRRLRYYMIARRDVTPTQFITPPASEEPPASAEPPTSEGLRFAVRDILEAELPQDVWLPESVTQRFRGALDIVDPDSSDAVTACFASGYGRSAIRSGSCLWDTNPSDAEKRLRRFSPREVARLLGFADTFHLPASLSTRRKWKLLGNSLSIPAIRYLLQLP